MLFKNIPLIKQVINIYREKRGLDLQKKEKDITSSFEKALTQKQLDEIRNQIKEKL